MCNQPYFFKEKQQDITRTQRRCDDIYQLFGEVMLPPSRVVTINAG